MPRRKAGRLLNGAGFSTASGPRNKSMKQITFDKTHVTVHGDRLEIQKTHSHDRMGTHTRFDDMTAPVIFDRVEAHRLADFIQREIPRPEI